MVRYDEPIRVDEFLFQINWTSDRTPPVAWELWVARRLVDAGVSLTGSGEFFLSQPPGDEPFFEIVDLEGEIPQVAFPGRNTIFWFGVADAQSYNVEQFVDGNWTLKQYMVDGGFGSFLYLSDWLADDTLHRFRVVPKDNNGNEASTPAEFQARMIRHPNTLDMTRLATTYDSITGRLTIGGA